MGEGVCYHPEINNLDEETITDKDKPYSPRPGLNRGDENLRIVLTGPKSRWTETIPVATLGLFLNPLEIPNIYTLAQIKRKGYINPQVEASHQGCCRRLLQEKPHTS